MRRLFAVIVVALTSLSLASPAQPQQEPTTGFEDNNGADWTTEEEELAFLAAVDDASDRVEIDVIGETLEGRPLLLVQIGAPRPRSAAAAREHPTELFVCSQHGNEPAGREACLIALRDLAFTDDPALVALLSEITFLFIPNANPDGRAANSRGNSEDTDINRDHLNLESREGRAIGAVVRDWQPDLTVDLHEYGPSVPVVYDDEILYLWPRNLNVDEQIHDLAKSYVLDDIVPCAEDAGYTTDEYGLFAAGDHDVIQTAGDEDEGIFRNAGGLRHGLGILFETAVSPDPRNVDIPPEVLDSATNRRRRVASHRTLIDCTFAYLADNAQNIAVATGEAAARKAIEGAQRSAPVYFCGADNEEPEPECVVDPPPCGYELTAKELDAVRVAMQLHAIRWIERGDGVRVLMGQSAEPLIPLLLDERGQRHSVEAQPLDDCRAAAPPTDPPPSGGPTTTSSPSPGSTGSPGATVSPAGGTTTGSTSPPLAETGGGAVVLALLALTGAAGAASAVRRRR